MEEVLIHKNPTTGTTAYVFDTVMSNPQAYDEVFKSFMVINPLGMPDGLYNYASGSALFIRNGNNNFVDINEITTNYITGYTGTLRFPELLTANEKSRYETRIKNNAFQLSANSQTFVFFEDKLNQDTFLNIGLHRTYDALNTLSIYNSSINSYPTIQSNTGVVFGRLEAIQKVLDPDSGKNVRIPLRNVPIGIFNTDSEAFPLPTAVDDNGNRIQLNLKPIIDRTNYLETEYFNQKSKTFDDAFLQSPSNFTSVPPQYKYITKTNDEGEFIIYDVPIGNNTMVFDVDLLKQGLTKEEVALNFFPYLNTESPNVDSLPHFFFRQVPVDVVPAWGDFQSGYTELNISVNLDLRKWSTFFVPPINFNGRNLQQLQDDDGITTPLKIFVKDMTKQNEVFSSTTEPYSTTEIVEIHDLLNRNIDRGDATNGQDYEWYTEFAQLKKSTEFFKNDFQAFKVPANMYNPYWFNSTEEKKDAKIRKRGVWFAGYQFKMLYLDNGYFRTSGFERQFVDVGNDGNAANDIVTSKDNYHINKFQGYNSSEGNIQSVGSGKGLFPYEKTWSYKYPQLATIPKPPVLMNPNWVRNGWGKNPLNLTPKFLDGDMIGLKKDGISGGFGLQQKNDNQGVFIQNKFSKRVNAGLLYKYESGVAWHETYANGFLPALSQGLSQVVGGERYQRVEAGFGYFLKMEGWPFVDGNDEYDFIIQKDGVGRVGVGTDMVVVNEDATFDLTLNTDPNTNGYAKEGGIDIYRIVKPEDVLAPDPNILPTFAVFKMGDLYRKKETNTDLALVIPSDAIKAGQQKSCYPIGFFGGDNNFFFGSCSLKLFNRGTTTVAIEGQRINPGEFYDFGTLGTNVGNVRLPGNDVFDITTFSFTKCNYDFVFGDYSEGTGSNSNDFILQTTVVKTIGADGVFITATENAVEYSLQSQYIANTQRIKLGDSVVLGDGTIITGCGNELESGGGRIYGIILGAENNCSILQSLPFRHNIFTTTPLNITCKNSFFRQNSNAAFSLGFPIEGITSYAYLSIGIERVG